MDNHSSLSHGSRLGLALSEIPVFLLKIVIKAVVLTTSVVRDASLLRSTRHRASDGALDVSRQTWHFHMALSSILGLPVRHTNLILLNISMELILEMETVLQSLSILALGTDRGQPFDSIVSH